MDKPLFSENWYRVKALRPKLRAHTRVKRHDYRGSIWYLLADEASSRFHRFNGQAYQVIGLMDGRRTVHQIWERVNTLLGDDAPVQDDIIYLLGQLHQMDALQTDIAPDIEELFQRGEEHQRKQLQARLRNPLALRVGLFDPDRFLERTLPAVRWLFSAPALVAWCCLVALAALLAGIHWPELAATARVEALTPTNLLMLCLVYPLVKLLHELGHAYAVKLGGGEVHEIGLMFLVFMPVPFVDASASTVFRSRGMRMLVSAAGIMVELLLAALALFVWLLVEPGLLSSACFNIMLIGGVSTVLFNGNPLLRFDGYYVLSDAIGIPNLGQRANQYIAYLAQRYLLGMETARSPVRERGERAWFFCYSLAAFAYRLSIMLVICLFLIDTLFIVGILLAVWAILNQLGLPLFKQLKFLVSEPALRRKRGRVMAVTGAGAALLCLLLLWLPFSSLTRFEGVIWPPHESQLVAETEGFVQRLLVEPGAAVELGQPLIELRNATHHGEMGVQQGRLRELQAKYRAARIADRVQAKLVTEEIAAVEGEIARLRDKLGALVISSPLRGRFVVPDAQDLPGQYVSQGRVLGYVIDDSSAVAQVVVTQQDQDRIASSLEGVQVRLAGAMHDVLPGRLLRAVPQASHQLPSKVLSVDGGGRFVPDPEGITELSTRERLFTYEIELPVPVERAMIGSRVHVRFDHGQESLWTQLSRRVRQLFLRHFDV